MSLKYLLHGTDRKLLYSLFDGNTHARIVKFTEDHVFAYQQSKRTLYKEAGGQPNRQPVVVVLTSPEIYAPHSAVSRVLNSYHQTFAINLRKNPIDHLTEDVIILNCPTLEELCEFVEKIKRG